MIHIVYYVAFWLLGYIHIAGKTGPKPSSCSYATNIHSEQRKSNVKSDPGHFHGPRSDMYPVQGHSLSQRGSSSVDTYPVFYNVTSVRTGMLHFIWLLRYWNATDITVLRDLTRSMFASVNTVLRVTLRLLLCTWVTSWSWTVCTGVWWWLCWNRSVNSRAKKHSNISELSIKTCNVKP